MNSSRIKVSCLALAAGLILFVPLAGFAQQPVVAETPVAEVSAPETAPAATDVPVAPKAAPDATQPVDPNQPEKIDHRILGVLPNYRTADGRAPFQPINWKFKLTIASKDSFDWPNYIIGGLFAGLYMADKDHPDFGEGVGGYARYYGTSYADQVIGNMLTEGVMPIIFHEDPRYFRKATGPKVNRLFYSLTRVLVCKTDHGNPTFNFSEVVGNSIGGSISNFYYSDQRSLNQTVVRTGTQIATDALSNTLKEFWPDIKRHLHHQKTAPQTVAEVR